jgi:hypothetical protein
LACERHRDDAKYLLRDKRIDRAGEFGLQRRVVIRLAFICAAALGLAACNNASGLFADKNDGEGFLTKPSSFFSRSDSVKSAGTDRGFQLGPSGPVAAEDLVGADGRCAAPLAQAAPPPPPAEPVQAAAQPTPPPDRPVGSMAGDLASAPMPVATPVSVQPTQPEPPPPGAPQIAGGVALGMSECDVVRRAGLASNVSIGAGEKGERKAILTYLTGPWPGIYTFDAGRLKIVDAAPAPPPSVKPPAKKKSAKKKPAKPKTASREIERPYVQ